MCIITGLRLYVRIHAIAEGEKMNELYAEATAKRKTTSGVIVLKFLAILIVFLVFIGSFLLPGGFMRLGMLIGGVLLVLVIWYWPRFHIEWEYIFCDGQLDFDMIMGGQKRRPILKIEIEEAALITAADSPKLENYRHLSVKDFTSQRDDANIYGIVTKKEQEEILILFEPSRKMLEMMKQKCPKIVDL